MPIQTQCPKCNKPYRLKDELAGKRVTCAEATCRHSFLVEVRPVVDAEKLAAEFFSDAPVQQKEVVDELMEVSCVACDHIWKESTSKMGKNVICPECKHRQKIPEKQTEKKIDWRDPTAARPTLAKGPELPDDLKEQQTRNVSIKTLKDAGAIPETQVEPLPLQILLARIMLGLGLLAGIVLGVLYFFQSRQDDQQQLFLNDGLALVEKINDESGLPKGQPELMRCLLRIAAVEHLIRQNRKEALPEAMSQISKARQELEKMPKSYEQEILLGKLAEVIILLGGDETQVGQEIRIRWTPGGNRGTRQTISGSDLNVQTELRRALGVLRSPEKPAEFDFRAALVRKLARKLSEQNQAMLLVDIASNCFFETEVPEATAQIVLEIHRASHSPLEVRQVAELLSSILTATTVAANPTPVSAQALWDVVDPPMTTAPKLVGTPSATGDLSASTRNYGVILAMVKKQDADALALATRGGLLADRLGALDRVAEYSADPTPAIKKAAEMLSTEARSLNRNTGQFVLLRLAECAAKNGLTAEAEAISNLISDDGLKRWAKAEIYDRQLRAAEDTAPAADQLKQPTDKNTIHISDCWMTLAYTRQLAKVSGNQSANDEYRQWDEVTFQGFGLVGLALGLQDRE